MQGTASIPAPGIGTLLFVPEVNRIICGEVTAGKRFRRGTTDPLTDQLQTDPHLSRPKTVPPDGCKEGAGNKPQQY